MNLINDEIPTKNSNISTDVKKLKNSIEVKKFSNVSKVISEQIKVKKAIQILKRSKTKSTQSVNLINTVTKENDNLQMSEFKAKYIKLGLSEKDSTQKNNYLETKNKTSIEEKENDIKNGTIVAKQSKCEEIINDALKNINQTTKNVIDIAEEAAEFEDVEIPEEVDEIIVPDEAAAEDLTDDEETEINTSFHEESTKSSVMDEKDENEILVNEDESDKKSINEEQRDESSKDFGEGDNEPELVTIEDDIKETLNCPLDNNTNDQEHLNEDSNKNLIHDPLNCADNQDDENEKTSNNKETEHCWKNKSNDNNDKDGDDDEVQFIETRNSPIYIESDEDEPDSKLTRANSNNTVSPNNCKQTITTESTTVTLSKNITVTRTSARKSTAKSQQQQQQNHAVISKSPAGTVPNILVRSKSKNSSCLKKVTNNKQSLSITSTQKIVDCIELLDSSDEECSSSHSRSSQQQQVKTPQKRTLLAAKGNYYKNYNKTTASNNNCMTNNFSPNLRQQAKKPLPPPLPPPTPQSNFLNAVQLQPAAVSGINPPTFSALLSNKNVIIPNAFYGNPPSVRDNSDTELDRRYASWLENFLNQFCKPQFVPTHSCYVFLQRALKYKDFVRIKTLRSSMNIHDQKDQINNQLMMALRTILLKNTKKITNYGRRFCELTCSSVHGKALTLMAHSITGKVTLKTCNIEMPRTSTTLSSASTSSNTSTNTLTRKRQLDEDEEEYTPDKSKLKYKPKSPSENLDRDSGETGEDRKRSLRTKRTKRLDNSFSYNEDDLLAEYEIEDEEEAEKLAQAEIQRKIDQKRLEAQKQRQQQVKSFESAFIQAFAKSIDGPTSSATAKNPSNHRIHLKNIVATSTSIKQYTSNNDAEDLLQATWIENLENDDTQIISDDDEPKEHRIYKQQQKEQLQIQSHQPQNNHTTTNTSIRFINANPPSTKFKQLPKNQEEIITGDDYNKNNNTVPFYWPKNIDPQMHINGKYKDRCIICNLSCQRLVHHYVNEHRGCEVYNSRLSPPQIKLLKQGNYTISSVSLYKNGQFQYEAYCIFCQKQSRFMLPYWYQHFTMHTGEYAYRCTGCGVRKPTRSLITQHQTQGCPADGGMAQDYLHDSKSSQIEAKICTLCNYVQLYRNNVVKHLHQQHNIKKILPKHIQTIVLLKASTTPATTTGSISSITSSGANTNRCYDNHVSSSSSFAHKTYVIDDDDTDNENNVILDDVATEDSPPPNTENHYYNYIPPYMQAAVNSGNFSFESVDASDDLSFMICGMLDVQMNPESN